MNYDVLTTAPIDKLYTYSSEFDLSVGQVVKVSLGSRLCYGVVIQKSDNNPQNIKSIEKVYHNIVIKNKLLKFIDWVSDYTLSPKGSVLKLVLSESSVFEKDIGSFGVNKSHGDVKFVLSESQREAVDKIVQHEAYNVSLLDGMTGSGKTEVYLYVVQSFLKKNKQILVLLPEIALTPQLVERFQKRLGIKPFLWHSGMTCKQRREIWMGALNNNIDVVVGARSALFLPFSNLGLIIVDEEHDGSYKQEESIIYNARDMSVVRAKIENIPIVLASATPSIETLTNGFTGKYEHIRLPYRFGSSRLPSISLVDMRMEKAKWFSERLLSEIKKTISNGEQVLLYINRRGYAPLTVCKSCGEKILCPNCSVSLVEHKSIKSLVCHYCNHMIKKPSECLSCKSQDLISWGPGIEQIYDEIKKIFHNSNVAIASSDTLSTTNKMNVFVEDVLNKKVDIIVGTQILAKGHHFPDLTLIGVIDSDAGLDSTDLRSSEKIFQMLYQVSGRAGREEKIGSVIIQTYKPEHPLYKSLVNLDRENFINEEISVRRISKMPPFTRLVAIIFSGNDARQVEETAKNFVRVSPDDDRIMVLGPAPAVLLRIRGKTRWRVLIKFSKECKLQDILDVWLKCVKNISSVRIKIDVDPLNFL